MPRSGEGRACVMAEGDTNSVLWSRFVARLSAEPQEHNKGDQ